MFTIHLVAYSSTTDQGIESGVARVGTCYSAPTWSECAVNIPGYIAGFDLGQEPQYTLRYSTPCGPREKHVGAAGVEHVGSVLVRCADRGEVWDIAVYDDATGADVTFDFGVFAI